jgi:hypothetical protein
MDGASTSLKAVPFAQLVRTKLMELDELAGTKGTGLGLRGRRSGRRGGRSGGSGGRGSGQWHSVGGGKKPERRDEIFMLFVVTLYMPLEVVLQRARWDIRIYTP